MTAFAIAAPLVALILVGQSQASAAPATDTYGIWDDSKKPASPASSDTSAVELGLQFSVAHDGWVTAIRYYKFDVEQPSSVGTLWTASGQVLAKAAFTSRDGTGWKSAPLASPVKVQSGQTYVASYTAPQGRYPADQNSLGSRYRVATRDLTALAGVYSYSLGFPNKSWNYANYFADVTFTTVDPTASTPTATAPSTTRPTTTAPTSSNSIAVPKTGFPSSSNSGYKVAPGYPGALTNCSGVVQSNTIYRFCNFPNGLSVGKANSPVSNVTFLGCRFASNALDDANVALRGDNITIDYSTFEPSADASPPTDYNQGYQYGIDVRYAGKVTIDHSDFWGWGNGIQFGSSSQAKPLVVRNTWFHDARNNGGIDHTDAILSNEGGPSYMVFDHNTIASAGNTQGLGLQTESRGYDHVTITNNYFSGFGYTVAIGENIPSTNITFTGNVYGTDIKPVWGPLYSNTKWTSSAGNLWRNNKWRVVSGSYYTPASDDGKFWLPSGAKSSIDYTG